MGLLINFKKQIFLALYTHQITCTFISTGPESLALAIGVEIDAFEDFGGWDNLGTMWNLIFYI